MITYYYYPIHNLEKRHLLFFPKLGILWLALSKIKGA